MVRVIQTLLTWYLDNHREMPWRETNDPYKIWISEIILQQTRVQQGLPYYHRFIDKFKTIRELAEAEESEVLKLWQGLGYYSRARNLHKAAKMVVDKFGGQFPENFDEILLLPGVGDYTASAISAFAFNKPAIAVDGNVKRLASRWLGIYLPVESTAFIKSAKSGLLDLLGNHPQVNLFNQAIIEMGATVCLPTQPQCEVCPLQNSCVAFAKSHQMELPLVAVKKKPIPVNLVFFAIRQASKWFLVVRDSQSVWANLYEFPSAELPDLETNPWECLERNFGISLPENHLKLEGYKDFKHQLSHRSIRARCWVISLPMEAELPKEWQPFEGPEIGKLPVHRLMEKMLEFAEVWK